MPLHSFYIKFSDANIMGNRESSPEQFLSINVTVHLLEILP